MSLQDEQPQTAERMVQVGVSLRDEQNLYCLHLATQHPPSPYPPWIKVLKIWNDL